MERSVEVNFSAPQLLEIAGEEISALRVMLREERKRREAAESVLEYYANPETYAVTRMQTDHVCFRDRICGDYSYVIDEPVAGVRARNYFLLLGREV